MPRRPLNCSKSQNARSPQICHKSLELSAPYEGESASERRRTSRVEPVPATFESEKSRQSGVSSESVPAAGNVSIPTDLLERYGQEYLLDCDYRLQAASTIAARRIFLKNLVWFLRHRGFDSCGTSELRQFFVYLARGHEEEGGRFGNKQLTRAVRPITHKDYWVNLKCFFNWLIEEGLIEVSPMARLPKPRVPEERVEPFTQEQVKAILQAAGRSLHPRRNEAIILFLLDTGVRASELCSLTLDNLDFQSRRAYVIGKGNKRRTVFFSRRTASALSNYVRHECLHKDDPRPDAPVFAQYRGASKGQPLTVNGLRQRVAHLITEAGIKGGKKSPHRFRHTCALWMLNNGSNIFHLKELLGHSSLTTCLTYLRISQADAEAHHNQFSPVEGLRTKQRNKI